MIDPDVLHGDSEVVLARYSAGHFDVVITDPDYGLKVGSLGGTFPTKGLWRAVFRVLKPGGFGFVMSPPRSDIMATNLCMLRGAGFDIGYTPIVWAYADGFPKAKKLDGGAYSGFQPKPAVEMVLVASKPGAQSRTYLENGRIPVNNPEVPHGRFPANLLVSDDSLNDGKIRKSGKYKGRGAGKGGIWGKSSGKPVGIEYGDSGSFSRFFDLDLWYSTQFAIISKPGRKEKGGFNNHPTVKPVGLMSYLVSISTQENDLVLDPFAGSGTTLIAAARLNRRSVGVELEERFVALIKERLAAETW